MTKDKRPLFLDDLAPWNENANPVWLASTLLMHRNIEKFNFPAKLSSERRKQIVSLVDKEVASLKAFESPVLLKSEDCTPLDKEFLVEHCLTNEGFLQATQGEAFIFDKRGTSLISVNIEDHLHFHFIDILGELEKGWSEIVSLETQLGESLAYCYSQKFGFLTANPFFSGTGLSICLFLQLSGLIHSGKWPAIREKFKEEPVEMQGLMGHPNEWVGDLVVVRNQYCLGLNEESIVASMRSFATKMLVEEAAARGQIKQQESAEIKDKVSRAYGLLIHSYQIETLEALNEIALLKLGLEMGWVKGVTMKDLNALFFSCRRAHLLRNEEKISMEEVGHRRAQFIHKALKKVELTI